MADLPPSEPATRADLAELTKAVLTTAAEHRDRHRQEHQQVRAELRAERISLARLLRSETTQLRLDLANRLDNATDRFDSLVLDRERAGPTLWLAITVQALAVAAVVAVFHLW